MAVAAAEAGSGGARTVHAMTHRQLDAYPDTGPRVLQLFLVVLVTVALYYESYVGGSVSTLLLDKLGASFGFYVTALAVGNLLGAFGSLLAGLTDRMGRANLIVGGLLVTGLGTAFAIPAVTSRWPFVVVTFVIGLIEGIVLVATPALVRDFSPQTGRATAMGLWTTGPVLGSLVVSVVGSETITATTDWQHEYRICGVVGLVVFVVALVGLRELAPGLRDQLMVSMKDRVLIEARAKGIDIAESLRNPWGQLLKPDVVVSALGVSVFLLVYYTSVGFGTIILTTVFGFSLNDANGLGNWQWATDAVALVVIGVVSDRLRVRKPFMMLGGAGGAVMLAVFLARFGHHTGYYELAFILAVTSVFFGFAYAPWMAGFTETVEARNPALIGTGLAVWGWILRIVVFVSFIVLPHVVNTVNPLVNYGGTVQTDAARYKPEIAFARSHAALIAFAQTHTQLIAFARTHTALIDFAETHAAVVATATRDRAQLADAQRLAPELAVIAAHPALFTELARYPNSATIPPALLSQAIAAAGGGTKGVAILTSIAINKAAINAVIAVAPALRSLTPYATQLRALAANSAALGRVSANAVPLRQLAAHADQLAAVARAAPALTYLQAHAASVVDAQRRSPGQWRHWYVACVAACVFFLGSIPLMRGRWSPSQARQDEETHEAMVRAEMERLHAP